MKFVRKHLLKLIGLTAILTFASLAVYIPAVQAAEKSLGTITSTGSSVNQTSTATPFNIPTNHRIAFVCDAAVYYNWDTTSGSSVASTTGIQVSSGVLLDTSSGVTLKYLNIISQSGTANCKVFDVAQW